MLNILLTNVYSKLEYSKEDENFNEINSCVENIYQRLSFFDSNALFTEKYNSFTRTGTRIWDGYVRFFNKRNNTFLTGHLSYIIQLIESNHVPYTITDHRTKPEVCPELIEKCGKYTMRDYQLEGIKTAIQKERGVFYHATASGKTVMALGITEAIPVRTLFLVDRVELLVQTYKLFKNNSTRSVGVITPQEFEPREITIGLQKTIYSRLKNRFRTEEMGTYLASVEMFFADECLSDDTEILTDSGWKLIKNLNKQEKVAQWNDSGEINFTKPIRYIEKNYNGNLIHWHGRNTDILATPEHLQPYISVNQMSGDSSKRKTYIKDIKLHEYVRIPVSGNNVGSAKLSPLMRFLIMMQADGYICPLNNTTSYKRVQFQFVKQRKIDRFFEIMSGLTFNWTENKPAGRKRRFTVEVPLNLEKDLRTVVNLSEVNEQFVDEFIKELVSWDGYTKDEELYYSTKISTDADTVQALCAIGNWTCSRRIQKDNRKSTYNDIHRLWFYKGSFRSGQSVKKENIPYNGKVYCVEVPYGNIIIRRNNKVMITGNCHKASSDTWRAVLRNMHTAYYRFGLSGTPLLEDKIRNMHMIGLLGRIIHRMQYKKLEEQGMIAKPTIFMNPSTSVRVPSASDYSSMYRIGIVENKDRNEQILECIKRHRGKSILVIVKHIDHGNRLIQMLTEKEEGYFVSGKDSKGERISIYNRFSGKDIPIVIASLIYKEGVDIPAIDVLIYAVGEKAPVTILQSIGRGARIRDDKKRLIFYDFNDDCCSIMKSHTRKRKKIYKNEGFEIVHMEDLDATFETSVC